MPAPGGVALPGLHLSIRRVPGIHLPVLSVSRLFGTWRACLSDSQLAVQDLASPTIPHQMHAPHVF